MFFLLPLMLVGCASSSPAAHVTTPNDVVESAEADPVDDGPVVATLYMMSRCPHCTHVLRAMIPLIRLLGDRLQLDVDYVGGEEGGRLVSPHGEPEVRGDMIELCVQRHASTERWLSFLACFHQTWREIPEGWEGCAESTQVDIEAVEGCVDGEEGTNLLRASFRRSADAGVDATPTLTIGAIEVLGARRPDILATAVCSQMAEPRPPICEQLDPVPYVPVTFLTDPRCEHLDCQVATDERALRKTIWGANIRHVSWDSDPGRALFREAKLRHLPALIVGSEIEDDPEAVEIRQALRKVGDVYVRTLGRFDPLAGEWAARLPIGVKLLNDVRCPEARCAAGRLERSLRRLLPTLDLEHIDYSTPEGRALHSQLSKALDPSGPSQTLPLIVFTSSITDDDEFYAQIGSNLVEFESGYLLSLGDWDPTAEICGNEVDDDGNGSTDCDDETCSGSLGCRPEKQRRLELYAMSQCPFAGSVFTAMKTVVEHFGRQRSKIDFRVNYIGNVDDDGELRSMHGPSEVAENIRQLCVQEHFSADYAFVDYLACRGANYRSDDWEPCVTSPLDPDVIRRCAEGDEGPRLLRESYERAEGLEMTSSPAWLLNNRVTMRGRTPPAIVAAFCEHNPQPECEQPVPDPPRDVPASAGGCGQ